MKKTTWVLFALVAGLIGWDVYLYATPGEITISRAIHDLGTRSWALLVGFGVLLGHWFWPLEQATPPEKQQP